MIGRPRVVSQITEITNVNSQDRERHNQQLLDIRPERYLPSVHQMNSWAIIARRFPTNLYGSKWNLQTVTSCKDLRPIERVCCSRHLTIDDISFFEEKVNHLSHVISVISSELLPQPQIINNSNAKRIHQTEPI